MKSRILWRCKECKGEGKEGGNCIKKGCKVTGTALIKACAASGSWPHGGDRP